MPEMSLDDVLDLLALADRLGVGLWVDGGWGVDAVLGRQTRPHDDLDIMIRRSDEPTFAAALRETGFGPVERNDTCAWNYVLGDDKGREVDFHVIEPAAGGDWHYGPAGGSPVDVIPGHALTGRGRIGPRPVRCVTPSEQVRYHTGYAVDANDWADVKALCEQFGLEVPSDYDDFRGIVG